MPPTPAREPIAVSVIRFVDDRQELPGRSMSSACTSASLNPAARHLIYFLPWLRCFQVDFLSEPGGRGTVKGSVMIPEARVQSWQTPISTAKDPPRKR